MTQPLEAQSSATVRPVTIAPHFSPDPLEIKGTVQSSIPLKEIVNQSDTPTGQCAGFADSRPNLTLVLTAFFDSLSLLVDSSEDTALAIQGPGGTWCNDDFQGKNPGVSGQWLPGTYKIWVSSYTRDHHPAYVIRLTQSP
ncbi:MAG: hypothetical protein WCA35_10425 [Kovacikia sp.]